MSSSRAGTPMAMSPETRKLSNDDLPPADTESDEECARDTTHAAMLPLAQRHSRFDYSSSGSGGGGGGRARSTSSGSSSHLPSGTLPMRSQRRFWSRCRRLLASHYLPHLLTILLSLWVLYLQCRLEDISHRVQPIGSEQQAYTRSHMRVLPRSLRSEAGRQQLALQRRFPYANLEGSGPFTVRSPVAAVHNDSRVPPFAAATLISPSTPNEEHNPCHMTYLLYRSLRRVDPEHTIDFLIFYVEDDEPAMRKMRAADHYCQLLDQQDLADQQSPVCVDNDDDRPSRSTSTNTAVFSGTASPHSRAASPAARRCFPRGSVRWLSVPNIDRLLRANPQIQPKQSNWAFSLNKLSIFAHTEYSRILVLDSDMLVVSPLHALFRLEVDLAGGQDTWACLHSQMNGGMFVFQPSEWLLEVVNSLATAEERPACISGQLAQSDQELLNCLCGWGGAGFSRRPEVRCQLLPWFANVIPGYQGCEDYHAHDVMVIHYAGVTKAWNRLPPECMTARVAAAATEDQPDEWFLAPERSRCFTDNSPIYTYFFCVQHHEDRHAHEWRAQKGAEVRRRPAEIPYHNCRLFET